MSYSWIKRDAADVSKVAGTFYTYDIHGNVDTLVQDYEGIAVMATDDRDRYKRITYNYDLISGKVNGVNYQPGETDAFYHRYYYDAENRLTSVKTSRDSVIWEEDAAYEYYRHGPLLRTKLGQLNVQGLDYAYTLQGWLKGINGTAVGDGSNDMGQDGLLDRMTVARDVFGLALHYYDTIGHSDYRAIGDGVAPFAKPNNADFRSLYNGNIAGMSVNLAALGRAASGVNAAPLFYKYRYDQLNRLVSMRAYKGFNNSTNAWTPVLLDDYREDVKYDANGNILNYIRNGSPEVPDSAKLMDSLTYKYWANTNQLKQVLDDAGYSGNYGADIDNQTETENYVYDAIGNLVQDKAENLIIAWNVYGKIDSIVKPGGTIKYTYDAAGNRISKSYDGKTTVYVRDASGNVMSIYQKDGAGTLDQSELHLYGSSRLGLTGKRTTDPEAVTLATGFDPGKLITFTRGEKIFELSNHLGNVLVTINDKKLATDDGNGEVAWYEADVVTANDYYPFGMIMPGRKLPESESYRHGFNGQERSAEIDPNGNSMTAEFWQYDARLGRRWNIDPKPNIRFSPYSVFEDNPVWHTDIRGDTVSPRPTPVSVGTMSYYIERVKDFQKRNPGAKIPEYYLGYGNVYINKFKNEIKQTLSGAGQEWLEKALVNLQTAIEDKLQSPKLEDRNLELNNKKFTDFAFGSHVKAYEDAGVLQLPIMDKVKIGLTPKAEDLFSDRGLAQAGQIAKDQAWYYLTHPIFALEQFTEVINNKDEIKARVHNYYLENKPFFDRKMEQNPQHWSNPEYRIMGIVRNIINPSFIF